MRIFHLKLSLPKNVLLNNNRMYGWFADPEFFSGAAHSGLMGNDIFTELNSPLFHNPFQLNPS